MLKQLGLREIKSENLDKSQKDKKIYVISEKISHINLNKMNLDSRVNSQNDISKLKESNILKHNSFFSQNF
jgi:Cu/Ag efflux protein CusF